MNWKLKIFGKSLKYIILIPMAIHPFWGIAQNTPNVTLWNIGNTDSSISEFALSPDDYKSFVAEGFGGADTYFTVGESSPSTDFPYLLPGPKDDFAGYSFWAGLALHKLPIYFEITQFPKSGICTLTIDLFAVSSVQAPLFRCSINGQIYEQQLDKGIAEIPRNLKPDPQKIVFTIPISSLKTGVNKMVLQNMSGNWCAFDAITFSGPDSLHIAKPGNTLVNSVAFSSFENKEGAESTLPLLVDLRHQGKRWRLKRYWTGKKKD